MYHPIPRRKVPSMGGCLFILAIMGFSVYGRYLHTYTPAIWYHRGRRRPRRRAYENRRMSAANRNCLATVKSVNRRQILRLVTAINGNRQPFNGGETSGPVVATKTAKTASKYQQINRHKVLAIVGGCFTIGVSWRAQRPTMGTLTIERQGKPVAAIH